MEHVNKAIEMATFIYAPLSTSIITLKEQS